MVIIGQKDIKPRKKKFYKFTCKGCGSVFVVEKEEIANVCFFDDIWREVICPKCSNRKVFNWLFFRRYRRKVENEIPKS